MPAKMRARTESEPDQPTAPPEPALSPRDQLIQAKVAAGLTRKQAEQVVKDQEEYDAQLKAGKIRRSASDR